MNESQEMGIITDTLEKAQEFKKNHPGFDSIYSMELNKTLEEHEYWGKFIE